MIPVTMFSKALLTERLTWDQANVMLEESVDKDGNGKAKNLFMRGIFIEGDVRNHNNRVYPQMEISKAVGQIRESMERGETIYGEADHPEELNINLDRVSHIVEEISLQGSKGIGKLRIVPTPMGQLVRTLIESGGKLGVSSRGSGNVDDGGRVSDFEIVTVDIVARPSAPNAYPTPIYERLMNYRRGTGIYALAESIKHDPAAQKHFRKEVLSFMDELFKS
jgi:hypothetical protein